MNDMARNRRKSAGGVESRALAGKKIQAPEIQKAVSVGVTLVEENLDTGDSWFVLGPSKMEKIRQPLIGVTGFRPAVDLKYRELLDQALEAIEKAARTGKIGDGKIFVTPIDHVIRIRTGETGASAL